MAAGRKRKSAAEHKANGNPSRREIRAEPEFLTVSGKMPPKYLNKIAAQEWHDLMPALERTGVMTECDLTAFAMYCWHFSMAREAMGKIEELGAVAENDKGNLHVSPWDTVARQHSALMKSYLSEFGLTPATRSKVAPASGGKEKDEFEEDFGG